MFLDSIRALFATGTTQPDALVVNEGRRADARHVAACALLLEVAHADGEFSQAERAHLESVLTGHFALDPADGRELLQLAESERSGSIDHHRFTTVLRTGYDLEQKMSLAESMWGLVLADGAIADHEHYLTRKIANLLDLQPAELSAAKAAAAARIRAE